jgi:c-di-GMP-binding flagellar brake protein YcgR
MGDQSCFNVPVNNLGSEGCCLRLASGLFNRLREKPVLESLELIHPSLPKGKVRARVVWVRPDREAGAGMLETGVQFLEIPPAFSNAVFRFVRNWAAPSTRKPEASGQCPYW